MTSTKAFVPLLVGSQIWKETGWATILYLRRSHGVNPELYEAAKVDGAKYFSRESFTFTLPQIKPTFIILLIYLWAAS